jgi:hypothetical protein
LEAAQLWLQKMRNDEKEAKRRYILEQAQRSKERMILLDKLHETRQKLKQKMEKEQKEKKREILRQKMVHFSCSSLVFSQDSKSRIIVSSNSIL